MQTRILRPNSLSESFASRTIYRVNDLSTIHTVWHCYSVERFANSASLGPGSNVKQKEGEKERKKKQKRLKVCRNDTKRSELETVGNFCHTWYVRATGGYLLDKSWPASLHAARYPIDVQPIVYIRSERERERENRPHSRAWSEQRLRSPVCAYPTPCTWYRQTPARRCSIHRTVRLARSTPRTRFPLTPIIVSALRPYLLPLPLRSQPANTVTPIITSQIVACSPVSTIRYRAIVSKYSLVFVDFSFYLSTLRRDIEGFWEIIFFFFL